MEALITEIVGIVFAVLGAFIIAMIKKNVDNEDLNKSLIDAVKYAEEVGTKYSSQKAIQAVKGSEKMQLAKKYLDEIHPNTYKKYGDKIELLIETKVAELMGTGATKAPIK